VVQQEQVVALSLSGVSKSFKGRLAVDNLSIEVLRGECLGLLGPNGAGKTTTLRLALGLTASDTGSVSLLGLSLPEAASRARSRVGVVPQADSLDPDFSVRENLEIFGQYFGLSQATLDSRIPGLLKFASLDKRENERVTSLSGGLKRRLTLARSLINEPELVFLDEPTTALDPQARHLIWERLQSLREHGKTLVLTTHFMDEAQRLCDRIAIIDHGRLVALGTPRELIRQYVGKDVIELFGRGVQQWLGAHAELSATSRVEVSGETAFIYSEDARSWLNALDATHSDVRPEYLFRPANLEDVFLRLTGRDLRDN